MAAGCPSVHPLTLPSPSTRNLAATNDASPRCARSARARARQQAQHRPCRGTLLHHELLSDLRACTHRILSRCFYHLMCLRCRRRLDGCRRRAHSGCGIGGGGGAQRTQRRCLNHHATPVAASKETPPADLAVMSSTRLIKHNPCHNPAATATAAATVTAAAAAAAASRSGSKPRDCSAEPRVAGTSGVAPITHEPRQSHCARQSLPDSHSQLQLSKLRLRGVAPRGLPLAQAHLCRTELARDELFAAVPSGGEGSRRSGSRRGCWSSSTTVVAPSSNHTVDTRWSRGRVGVGSTRFLGRPPLLRFLGQSRRRRRRRCATCGVAAICRSMGFTRCLCIHLRCQLDQTYALWCSAALPGAHHGRRGLDSPIGGRIIDATALRTPGVLDLSDSHRPPPHVRH